MNRINLRISGGALKEMSLSPVDDKRTRYTPVKVKDAVFSILIVEEEKASRCSFRACDNAINAQEIASIFGGGGHKQASGCVMDLQLSDALKEIREKVKDYVERNSSC